MKRVAVFGNAGGGKSTLARRLAELTRLPLHSIDKMQFRDGGDPIPDQDYQQAHARLLQQDEWIIDGFGGAAAAWERLAVADTLIHIDLPLVIHGWYITKRLAKGLFVAPEGWPKDSPLWSSSLFSYKALRPCHRDLTPRYRRLVAAAAGSKRIHHLTSAGSVTSFLEDVRREYADRS